MKQRIIASRITVFLLFVSSLAAAQDSRYRPDRQQIPGPACLTMKGAWEGGSKALHARGT